MVYNSMGRFNVANRTTVYTVHNMVYNSTGRFTVCNRTTVYTVHNMVYNSTCRFNVDSNDLLTLPLNVDCSNFYHNLFPLFSDHVPGMEVE